MAKKDKETNDDIIVGGFGNAGKPAPKPEPTDTTDKDKD
jgi:hypothetical protein